MEMFHAAGHTIGMDTIRHIDTTIEFDILDRYEKSDNVYIPYEIAPYSPGRIILASYVITLIDILEETLGGKNTFHVETWMIAGTAKQRKCYPVHTIAERLPAPIIEIF